MHFVVTWEIKNAARRPIVESGLEAAIKPYSWVKPTSNCFVVQVASQLQYDQVAEAIVEVSRQNSSDAWVLITPPMTAGRYTGWLPNNHWEDLNRKAI